MEDLKLTHRWWSKIPLYYPHGGCLLNKDGNYNRPVYRLVHAKCGNVKWYPYGLNASDYIWCERCGQYIERPLPGEYVVVRWVDTALWYKPWTWLTGYWVEKEERKTESI